jgi:hypothetical protein
MFWFLWLLLAIDAQQLTIFQRRFIRPKFPRTPQVSSASSPLITQDVTPSSQIVISTDDDLLFMFPDVSGSGPDVQAARLVLLQSKSYPDIQHVNDMTDEPLKALHVMDNNYVTKAIKTLHMKWHVRNSIGGLEGPGSGSIFIGMLGIVLEVSQDPVLDLFLLVCICL